MVEELALSGAAHVCASAKGRADMMHQSIRLRDVMGDLEQDAEEYMREAADCGLGEHRLVHRLRERLQEFRCLSAEYIDWQEMPELPPGNQTPISVVKNTYANVLRTIRHLGHCQRIHERLEDLYRYLERDTDALKQEVKDCQQDRASQASFAALEELLSSAGPAMPSSTLLQDSQPQSPPSSSPPERPSLKLGTEETKDASKPDGEAAPTATATVDTLYTRSSSNASTVSLSTSEASSSTTPRLKSVHAPGQSSGGYADQVETWKALRGMFRAHITNMHERWALHVFDHAQQDFERFETLCGGLSQLPRQDDNAEDMIRKIQEVTERAEGVIEIAGHERYHPKEESHKSFIERFRHARHAWTPDNHRLRLAAFTTALNSLQDSINAQLQGRSLPATQASSQVYPPTATEAPGHLRVTTGQSWALSDSEERHSDAFVSEVGRFALLDCTNAGRARDDQILRQRHDIAMDALAARSGDADDVEAGER